MRHVSILHEVINVLQNFTGLELEKTKVKGKEDRMSVNISYLGWLEF